MIEILKTLALLHVYVALGVWIGKVAYRPELSKRRDARDVWPGIMCGIFWPVVIPGWVVFCLIVRWSKFCFIAIPKWYQVRVALARDNINRPLPDIPVARTRRKKKNV